MRLATGTVKKIPKEQRLTNSHAFKAFLSKVIVI
ncbi:unnamed protein product, partial [marine sediment metagenome]